VAKVFLIKPVISGCDLSLWKPTGLLFFFSRFFGPENANESCCDGRYFPLVTLGPFMHPEMDTFVYSRKAPAYAELDNRENGLKDSTGRYSHGFSRVRVDEAFPRNPNEYRGTGFNRILECGEVSAESSKSLRRPQRTCTGESAGIRTRKAPSDAHAPLVSVYGVATWISQPAWCVGIVDSVFIRVAAGFNADLLETLRSRVRST
jgi:hypothetical protein